MKRLLTTVLTISLCLLIMSACSEKRTDIAEENTSDQVSDEMMCTLLVECKTAIGRFDEKQDILPPDGIIYEETQVPFNEGDTVFDVLKREMRNNKIHLEYSMTPVYDNAYIEGIGNLYEFDCGELSGWMFRVNGEFPGVGCSDVKVRNGDRIEFVYSCDMGRDVGKDRELTS